MKILKKKNVGRRGGWLREKLGFLMPARGHYQKMGLVLILVTAGLLLLPEKAQAFSLFGLDDIAYWVIGKIAFGISWVIGMLAGIAIAIEALFLEIILNLNTQITNSAPVKFGFPVTLSIANLGFVAAIIIIAVATILRIQSYGIKQILWKLIVAALLVNFSLVFAGAILNVADQFTLYFLRQVNPAAEGAGVESSFISFASALAGAFNPQKAFTQGQGITAPQNRKEVEKLGEKGSLSGDDKDVGTILAPLASLFFSGISLVVIVVTLAAVVVMMLIRYVFLGILLILMPLAWLAWIFPGLKGNWSKWWKNFLKWTFFAPLMVFFLYLAIRVSYDLSDGRVYNFSTHTSASGSGAWAAIQDFFSKILSGVAQNLLDQMMIVGIMAGGLFAANALSIVGAQTAMKMAQTGAARVAGGTAGAISWLPRRAAGAAARTATRQAPLLREPPKVTGVASWAQNKYRNFINPVKQKLWDSKAATFVRKPLQKGTAAVFSVLPEEAGERALEGLVDFGLKPRSLKATLKEGAKRGEGLFKKLGKGEKKKKKITPHERKIKYAHITDEELKDLGIEVEEEI